MLSIRKKHKELVDKTNNFINNKYGFKSYRLIQSGGSINKIKQILKNYNEINISVDELESLDDEIRILFLSIDNTDICASFVITSIIEIIDIKNQGNCIKTNNKFVSVLVKNIIDIAKQLNINHIELSDNSYYRCIDKLNNKSYSYKLDLANTLTNGIPYYYKYKFKYQNKRDHNAVKMNYNKLKNMQTKDLDRNIIFSSIDEQIQDKSDIEKIKKEIDLLYKKYKESNVKKLFYEIKYKMCNIFSLIYDSIFFKLGLVKYTDKIMILDL